MALERAGAGRIIGCARYKRSQEQVELGGFVVANRGTRASLLIVEKVKELAHHLGDKRFIADATVNGSAPILKKLGGLVIGTYFDVHYQEAVELIEISL